MKILIVDDSKNIRTTIQHLLENEKHEFDIAMNGKEALDKILTNEFDLVFLDIRMPTMDGMEVLREIRKKGNKTPVVILSAYGTVDNAVEAMKLGVVDFMTKPFTPTEIRELLQSFEKREAFTEEEEDREKEMSLAELEQYVKRLISSEKYKKAMDILKKYLEKYQDSGIIYYYLGLLSESREDFEKALKYYRTALVFNNELVQAEINLSKLLEKRNDNG
ncbi:MAG: response regulator [Thermotogota bacterium]|nr:response regulator [Thermotogota bacterium]